VAKTNAGDSFDSENSNVGGSDADEQPCSESLVTQENTQANKMVVEKEYGFGISSSSSSSTDSSSGKEIKANENAHNSPKRDANAGGIKKNDPSNTARSEKKSVTSAADMQDAKQLLAVEQLFSDSRGPHIDNGTSNYSADMVDRLGGMNELKIINELMSIKISNMTQESRLLGRNLGNKFDKIAYGGSLLLTIPLFSIGSLLFAITGKMKCRKARSNFGPREKEEAISIDSDSDECGLGDLASDDSMCIDDDGGESPVKVRLS
jgi:hypothetical protein